VLHQLRYALGYAGDGGHALERHGHGYMELVVPLVAVLMALAGGRFIARLAEVRRGCRPAVWSRPPGRLWIAATLALLAIYAGQELVEGAVAAGHPAGLAALAAGGGWWAIPLAAALGLAVALLTRGADVALAAAARRAPLPRSRPANFAAILRPDLPRGRVLARHLAGRAPPIPSA
jgi:hypothetical protein